MEDVELEQFFYATPRCKQQSFQLLIINQYNKIIVFVIFVCRSLTSLPKSKI